MDYPYMDPNDAPWTEEYWEIQHDREAKRLAQEIEQEERDYEHGYIPRRPGR